MMKKIITFKWLTIVCVSLALGGVIFGSMVFLTPATAHQDGVSCGIAYCRTMNLNPRLFTSDGVLGGGWHWLRGAVERGGTWEFNVPPAFRVDPTSNKNKPYLIINFRVPVYTTNLDCNGVTTESYDNQCIVRVVGAGIEFKETINLIDMGTKKSPEDHRGVTSVKVYTGRFTSGPIKVTLIRRPGGPECPSLTSEPHIGVNKNACWLTYIFTQATTTPIPPGTGTTGPGTVVVP